MTSLWQDMKKDLKWAALIVTVIMGYAFCSDANAQVITQPVYTRPSKGATIPVFSGQQNAADVTTSQVYDWTAFYSMRVTIKFAKPNGTQGCTCPAAGVPLKTDCSYSFPYFNIQGSDSKDGPFITFNQPFTEAPHIMGNLGPEAASTSSINVQSTYVRFQIKPGLYRDRAGNPIADPCVATVTATPLPYPYSQTVSGERVSFTQSSLNNQNGLTLLPVTVGAVDWQNDGFPVPLNLSQANGALKVRDHWEPILSDYDSEAVVDVVQLGKVCATNNDCSNKGGSTGSSDCVGGFCGATKLWRVPGYGADGVFLQNVSTRVLKCAAGSGGYYVNANRYSFVLKADSTGTPNGDGGTFTMPNMSVIPGGDENAKWVYCGAVGGAGKVAVMTR